MIDKVHKFIITMILAVMVLMTVYLFEHFNMRSDISFFLPEQQSQAHAILQHQLKEGESARIILIAIRSKNPEQTSDLALISQQLRQKLVESHHFSQVENGSSQPE